MTLAAEEAAQPTRFGERYWLTRLLAVGGMAEIYLARQNAMAGFDKDVVIKRLKPELAGDHRIVEMFLDEARIGAVLNHPNIVHVYDVDEHDGIPYIAMEYIHGEELNQLCRRGLSLGKFLPLEHAVELIRQAAAGMGYFHHRRGRVRGSSGTHAGGADENLDIVHLDISPTNLLVTDDGFLKVIDFGIARAKGQKFRDEGAIPGKLSYMSPEQAARQRVDHRSDIFSLGVVLYEIVVGKRLFKGPAAEVVKKLIACEIEPPTFVKHDFPGPLEGVVMRCLERHPGDRYQSAYDLADDLEEILRELRLHSGPVRIARYLDELITASGGQGRPELTPEAAQGHDDDLDFDSKLFDGYRAAAPGEVGAAAEWDEYEEGDEGLAEALGMDLDKLRQMRTPVPGRPRGDDDDRGGPPGPAAGAAPRGRAASASPPAAPPEPAARLEPDRLPLRPPEPEPDPAPPIAPAAPPVVAAAPPVVAATPPVIAAPPSVIAATPPVAAAAPAPAGGGFPPWLLFGGLGAAALAAILYLLL